MTCVCQMCNVQFDGTADRKFCSRACANKRQTLNSPHRHCDHCGNLFAVKTWKLKIGKGHFCSRDCYLAAVKPQDKACKTCGGAIPMTGWHNEAKFCSQDCYHARPRVLSLNPNRVYNTLWRKVRDEVMARDGNRCVSCGTADGRLEVHHIVPVRLGGGHIQRNLKTLCVPCHRAEDRAITDQPQLVLEAVI